MPGALDWCAASLGVVASFTPWNSANVLSGGRSFRPSRRKHRGGRPSGSLGLSRNHGRRVAEAVTRVINVVRMRQEPQAPLPTSSSIVPGSSHQPDRRVKTARMLAERTGRTLKRTVLELGGFNPMIILDDVDMDYAVRTATFGSFFHQGQICLNTRRIIIQRKIYEEFLGKFVARTNSLPTGDPLNPKTIIGPIITRDAVKLIDERVKEAVTRGARVHTGAKHDGQIYYPTILTDVPLDAAMANEETFGPVVVVEAVDTPDEAIAAANRTMYGLTSSILAGNTYKAFEMAPKILAGIVNVNSPTVNDEIHAPMGGVRDSGWGRTGPRSLDDFSDVIWINSHSGQRQYPF